ncbi:MAG: GtrA family protein [Bacillota bacterium]
MSRLGIFRSKQFVKFMLVGGSAAAVNFLSRLLLDYLLSYALSIIIAYIIGMIVAFLLNKWLVFEEADNQTTRQFIMFIVVNIFAVLQTYAISMLLVKWFLPFLDFDWHSHEVAHFVGISVPIVTSYIGHKYFTFKPSKAEAKSSSI